MQFEKAGLSYYAIEPLIICLSHCFEVDNQTQELCKQVWWSIITSLFDKHFKMISLKWWLQLIWFIYLFIIYN